jgi:hypothetical protein
LYLGSGLAIFVSDNKYSHSNMSRKYVIDEKLETAKNEIVKLIEVHSTDSFKVHLSQIFLVRNVDKCCGYYQDHHFTIWFMYTGANRANFFSSKFFGTNAFYPIVRGTISSFENHNYLIIKSRMNPVGLIITLLIAGGMIYALSGYSFAADNSFLKIIRSILLITLMFSSIVSLPLIICRLVRRGIIKELEEKLHLKRY